MTNGYMVYLLRILAAQGALASVYTDPEDPEGFSAGFVEAVDGQHVLMCDLSPWGQIDGWRVRRNQDVIQVLAGEEYEQRLAMLLAYHKQHHRCFFTEAPAEDTDLLGRAQKAGVDGVEGGVKGLPVAEGLLHSAGEVLEGGGLRGGEGGVGGEDRGGQGTALGAHDGEDRQDHREGAAAQAGQILDGGYLGCAIHDIPPMRPPVPSGVTRHSRSHDTTFCPQAQLTFSALNGRIKPMFRPCK